MKCIPTGRARAVFTLTSLLLTACGGGGGGGDGVPFFGGVYSGVLVEQTRSCPGIGLNQPIGSSLTVNQDERRILADQGSLHHEGTVTSDDSFTATRHHVDTNGCVTDSTVQMTNITSSSGDERLEVTVQCGALRCTVVLRAATARASALSRGLPNEKPFAEVVAELASAVADSQE